MQLLKHEHACPLDDPQRRTKETQIADYYPGPWGTSAQSIVFGFWGFAYKRHRKPHVLLENAFPEYQAQETHTQQEQASARGTHVRPEFSVPYADTFLRYPEHCPEGASVVLSWN